MPDISRSCASATRRSRCPSSSGTEGERADRHPQAARPDRAHHPRPRLRQHGLVPQRDHVHRRREGHPALPRLPDRGAGREGDVPRGRVPADRRRAADAEQQLDAVHAARSATTPCSTRTSGASSSAARRTRTRWRPARRPSARWRPSTRTRSTRATSARSRSPSPAAREDADDRGLRVQALDRAAVHVPAQRLSTTSANFLHMMFATPCEAVRRRPGRREGARPAADPARRPRAELLDAHGAPGRLARRRTCSRAISAGISALWGPLPRRREPGGDRDARARSQRGRHLGRASSSSARRTRRHDAPDGLRPPRLQELRPARGDHQEGLRRRAREARRATSRCSRSRSSSRRSRSRTSTSSSASSTRTSTSTRASSTRAIGSPTNMFTVMFALGRLPGWIAHWLEMHADPDMQIGRPRQIYIGPTREPTCRSTSAAEGVRLDRRAPRRAATARSVPGRRLGLRRPARLLHHRALDRRPGALRRAPRAAPGARRRGARPRRASIRALRGARSRSSGAPHSANGDGRRPAPGEPRRRRRAAPGAARRARSGPSRRAWQRADRRRTAHAGPAPLAGREARRPSAHRARRRGGARSRLRRGAAVRRRAAASSKASRTQHRRGVAADGGLVVRRRSRAAASQASRARSCRARARRAAASATSRAASSRAAREIVALNAVRGARAIMRLDGRPVGDGAPGRVGRAARGKSLAAAE